MSSLRRSSFKRPTFERKPWVPTVVAPEHRRGKMAPVGEPIKSEMLPALDVEALERHSWENLTRPPRRQGRGSRDKSTKAHLDRLFRHGCIACVLLYGTPTEPHIHHPRPFAGAGERADDWLAIPLCPPHHTGPEGVHGDRSVLRQLNMGEPQLLAIVLRRIYGGGS